eukprot:TRINITY_DN48979_c0_g1_i1.p1 TRINITY_DN48979_c0_g1~~TRINITY_DN48979_c0_g1_i1.p1  ORF type:complete len:473 (+),score=133.81 TRINITY_DN48979_c0_g1_i1:92-1510(+)
MLTGVVSGWKNERGFGFIVTADGASIFAHHSDLDGGYLRKGQQVSFAIAEIGQGKMKAVHMSGPGVVRGRPQLEMPTPEGAEDGAEERKLVLVVEQRRASADLKGMWEAILKLRERWLTAQRRISERPGLDFHSFQKPYMTAFNAFRGALGEARSAELPERRWVGEGEGGNLRALTLNVLSQQLLDVFAYQSVVMPLDAGDFLTWEARRPLLVAELLRWRPDVVALQEVDVEHHDELASALAEHGYVSFGVQPRGRLSGTPAKDGVCLLYRSDTLAPLKALTQHVAHHCRGTANPGGVAAAASFTHLPTGRALLVGCMHVTPSPDAKDMFGSGGRSYSGSTDDAVVAQLLELLHSVSVGRDPAVILLGDANGVTQEGVAALADHGLQSAYSCVGERGMEQWEGTMITCHNDLYHWGGELDVVLFKRAALRQVLQVPAHPLLRPQRTAEHASLGLPMPGWPSDHVSLAADFEL